MKRKAEYIWKDGTHPTTLMRSKSRVVEISDQPVTINDFPEWGFDGSSTNQATGFNSDCILRPVSFVPDPTQESGHYLVMCEVFDRDGKPHPTNTRSVLREVLVAGSAAQEPFFGFEQEYTLFNLNGRPLGWPETGQPFAQGPYYCGVGAGRVAGRDLVEAHYQACIEAGLLIYGINAEVMLGQWEFQIGYRGFNEAADALKTTDDMGFATWLLHRLSEDYDIAVSYENKPIKGDWNGAGCHANFSTKDMRDIKTGRSAIENAISSLEKNHLSHIAIYGHGLSDRLTGAHETCDIHTFRAGDSDRGASIRIPVTTSKKGYGYLEDRRPGANSDPYLVAARILASVCGIEIEAFNVTPKESVLV